MTPKPKSNFLNERFSKFRVYKAGAERPSVSVDSWAQPRCADSGDRGGGTGVCRSNKDPRWFCRQRYSDHTETGCSPGRWRQLPGTGKRQDDQTEGHQCRPEAALLPTPRCSLPAPPQSQEQSLQRWQQGQAAIRGAPPENQCEVLACI